MKERIRSKYLLLVYKSGRRSAGCSYSRQNGHVIMENKDRLQFLSNLFFEILPELSKVANMFVCINDIILIIDRNDDDNVSVEARRWAAKKRIENNMTNYSIPFIKRANVRLTDFVPNDCTTMPDAYFAGCSKAPLMMSAQVPIQVYCPYFSGR